MRALAATAGSTGTAQRRLPRLQPDLRSRGARLCATGHAHRRAQRRLGGGHADLHRVHRLHVHARADRLPADRGPGLPDRERAASRRRLARAHAEGAGSCPGDRPQDPRRRASRDHCRGLRARRQCDAVERGRGLHHPEGLGPARTRPGPVLAVHRAQPIDGGDRGSAHHGAAAAADPGRRQCRRRNHADRAAGRQLRSRQAAEHRRSDGDERAVAVEPAARAGTLSLDHSAIRHRSRSREDPDAAA